MQKDGEIRSDADDGRENRTEGTPRCASIELCDRMAQGTITSTESLIQALNEQGETGENPKVLLEWVDAYIEWFDELRSKGAIKRCAPLWEYCVLGGIKPVHKEQKSLLSNYFDGLCNTISTEYQHGEEPLVEALEHTLQTIDIDVFDGNPAPLEKLGKKLLAKLDHTETNFTRAAYPSYRSILHALHLTLVLIKRIDPNQWDATTEDGLYSKFKVQVQGIAKSSKHYLVCYHANLIEQSLRRLALAGEYAQFRDDCRRIRRGLQGLHSFWKGAKSIASLEFDIGAFKSAYENFQAAKSSQQIRKMSWYDLHQSLHHACLRSLTDKAEYEVFKERLQDVQKMEGFKGIWENRKALRIGVIQQLRLLVLEGRDACIRKASMEELSSLAESCKSSQWLQWLEDKDILEELLDCLGTIAVHSQGEVKEAAILAFEIMEDGPRESSKGLFNLFQLGRTPKTYVQRGIDAWLGERTLEEKLKTIPGPRASTPSNSLFSIINRKLRLEAPVQTRADAMPAEEAHQALRQHYLDPSFATIRSLFRGQAPKHVDSLQCQLMLIEQVQTFSKIESKDDLRVIEQVGEGLDKGHNNAQEDDLCVHHKRLEWVKTPILLEDVMKSRSIKPGGPEHEIQRVLLVGNPGTGKTALSRKLAYSWAIGLWGREFPAMYVLPVRALQQSKYDNVSTRRDETLATAVANNCFPLQNKDEAYKHLRNRISEDLEHPMTLVVLDGLDERYGASEELLKQAKAGPHKLLMLSRPYGIEAERPLADIEIEHVGLNDQQMEAFIKCELGGEGDGEAGGAKELLALIHARPALQATAHVPVNLQILCTTWQDEQGSVCSETKQGSLHGLYKKLTMCVWDRYKKEKAQKLQDQGPEVLFTALGHIAMEGLQKGALLFRQEMVDAALDKAGGCVRAMVDDAGFLLLQDVGKEYQFPHLTFQEYFAGCLLARQFSSEEAQEQGMAKEFVTNNKYHPRYRVMFSFMAGELVKMQGFDGVKHLLMVIEANPREVVGLQHVLLQAQILNDWLCVCEEDIEKKLSELEGTFRILENVNAWFVKGLQSKEREKTKILSALTAHLQGSHLVAHDAALQMYLINASMDSTLETRLAAMEVIGKIVKVVPGLATALQEALMTACNHPDWRTGLAAVRDIGKMAEVAPGLAPVFQEILMTASNRSDWRICLFAILGIGEVVEIAPELAPALQKILIGACNHSDQGIRKTAVLSIGKVVEVAPQLAPVFQEALLAACNDSQWRVRWAAFEGVSKMVEVAPGLAPASKKALIAACSDSSWKVRRAAVEGVGKMVKVAPGLAPACQDALIAACSDSDQDICQVAVLGVGQMVKVAPELATAFQETLIAACSHSDWKVRRGAAEGIGEMVKFAPGLALTFQKTLIAACTHSDWKVRRGAVEGIGEMVKVVPGLAPAFQEALTAACSNASWEVRKVALEGIGKVVKVAPGLAPAFQEALIGVCNNSAWDICQVTAEGIGMMVEIVPGLAPVFQKALISACSDSCWEVRKVALEAIGKVVEVVPELAPAFQSALIAACSDPDSGICQVAVEGIGRMVKVAPGLAPAFREALIASCSNSSREVHKAALEGVSWVVEVAPGQAPAFQEAVLALCQDSNYGVRDAALEVACKMLKIAPEQVTYDVRERLLRAWCATNRVRVLDPPDMFSLQELIEDFWIAQNELFLVPLISSLYSTPLVVHSDPCGHQHCLVLYPPASKPVIWKKPDKAVKAFVKRVQSIEKWMTEKVDGKEVSFWMRHLQWIS